VEGVMTNFEEFRAKRLWDIGTRYQHYSDLLSIWEETVELMSNYSHLGKYDESKQKLLEAAIELLRNTLDGMSEYHDLMISIRKLVDYIPTDPTVTQGGRGTPLSKKYKLGSGDKYEDIG
jgi:hypothetical protein